jgi:hypothetical protein
MSVSRSDTAALQLALRIRLPPNNRRQPLPTLARLAPKPERGLAFDACVPAPQGGRTARRGWALLFQYRRALSDPFSNRFLRLAP